MSALDSRALSNLAQLGIRGWIGSLPTLALIWTTPQRDVFIPYGVVLVDEADDFLDGEFEGGEFYV